MAGPYVIRFATEAIEDLGSMRAFDRASVRQEITQHLTHAPTHVSRSRIKRMTQPFWSEYRLRVGDFRVYYNVTENERSVGILRIVRKGSKQTPQEPP